MPGNIQQPIQLQPRPQIQPQTLPQPQGQPFNPQLEQLPPEASPTLYVDGMALDVTKREMSHIFRPFEGFKVSLRRHSPSCPVLNPKPKCRLCWSSSVVGLVDKIAVVSFPAPKMVARLRKVLFRCTYQRLSIFTLLGLIIACCKFS